MQAAAFSPSQQACGWQMQQHIPRPHGTVAAAAVAAAAAPAAAARVKSSRGSGSSSGGGGSWHGSAGSGCGSAHQHRQRARGHWRVHLGCRLLGAGLFRHPHLAGAPVGSNVSTCTSWHALLYLLSCHAAWHMLSVHLHGYPREGCCKLADVHCCYGASSKHTSAANPNNLPVAASRSGVLTGLAADRHCDRAARTRDCH